MKRISIVLLLVVVLAGMANAQPKKNVLKINPLSGLVKTANISYERGLTNSSSLQLGFFWSGIKLGDIRYQGFGITPEYRIYLGKQDAPEGFYIAPFARYQNFSLKETETKAKATLSTLGGGAIIGSHWLLGETFSIDIFLGPGFNSGDVKSKTEGESMEVDNVFSGFGLRTGFTLGFAF